MLLDRDRVVGAALHRGVVGDNHALAAATRPMPVMMPADGASSSYMPYAASWDSSRNGGPGQQPRTRSRGSSLPRATWRCAPAVAALPGAHRRLQVVDQGAHRRGVRLERGRAGVDGAGDDAHRLKIRGVDLSRTFGPREREVKSGFALSQATAKLSLVVHASVSVEEWRHYEPRTRSATDFFAGGSTCGSVHSQFPHTVMCGGSSRSSGLYHDAQSVAIRTSGSGLRLSALVAHERTGTSSQTAPVAPAAESASWRTAF